MKRLAGLGMLLVTIAVPFFLLMTSIRILMIPYLYLDFEYHTPGFPPDSYGFSLQDRLQWSKISMDYLLNDQGISWLANQKLADGSPLIYRPRTQPHAGCKKFDPVDVCGLVDPAGSPGGCWPDQLGS